MKDIVPETLEEALKLIEKQKQELQRKESENKLRNLFREKKISEADFLRLRFDTGYECCRTRSKTFCNGKKKFFIFWQWNRSQKHLLHVYID